MTRAIHGLVLVFGMLGLFACQDRGSSSSPDGGAAPQIGSKPAGWRLTLQISVPESGADGGVAYNRLSAGVGETATDGFDNAGDVRALLYTDAPIQAYFAHAGDAGYDTNSQQLWQDLRSLNLPAEWRIEVVAASGRTVTVSWVPPAGGVSCATHQFMLWNTEGQLPQTDLCASGPLTYAADGQIRHFVLRVS
ncbi:MAG: hypothetical protein HY204_01535 [Nitrospirae bacterium]|nr:hypothetical protein [Nitrospirota bacterium]